MRNGDIIPPPRLNEFNSCLPIFYFLRIVARCSLSQSLAALLRSLLGVELGHADPVMCNIRCCSVAVLKISSGQLGVCAFFLKLTHKNTNVLLHRIIQLLVKIGR